MKKVPTRSGEAQAALGRRAPVMDHRNEPRGGTTNETRDLLDDEYLIPADVCMGCSTDLVDGLCPDAECDWYKNAVEHDLT